MDPIELLDQPGYQRHHRLYNWMDVYASDIKIFLAHVIVMGLLIDDKQILEAQFFR